jgi:hypothetical protein
MKYEGRPIRGVQIHQKLAASLRAVFDDIAAQVGHDWTRLPPGAVNFSGSYNFRPIRGSSRMSCHAFGAAIDLDAEHNPMNYEHNRGTMSPLVIDAFKRQGWYWGGDFHSRQDPMHFQAANEGPSREETADDGQPVGMAPMVAADDDMEPLETSIPGSETLPATPTPPASETESSPPSMLRSKTGWAAVGLGGSGVLGGLQQANDYAGQITMMKWNLQGLNASEVAHWLLYHPMVFVPVIVLAAAIFVWEDHRKYKRLLHAALRKQ